MVKVVIVDDEVLVRLGIRTTIDWNKYGFDIVGEADNGLRALEVVRETQPDVVLVDIRMPKMDGLTFIKKLKSEFPQVKTVILSCYNDFEYVREALRLGALDYILKLSTDAEDLIKVMESVKAKIEEERLRRDEVVRLQQLVNTNIHEIRSKYFNDLINSDSSMGISDNEMKALQLRLTGDKYVVLCLKVDGDDSPHKVIAAEGHLFKLSVINLLDEVTNKGNLCGNVFARDDKEFAVLMCFNGEKVDTILKNAKELAQHIIDVLRLYMGISVSVGISDVFEDIKDVKNRYKEASLAVESRIYTGKESIAYCGDVLPYEEAMVYNGDKEKKLRDALEEKRIDEAYKIIYNLLDQVRANHRISPSRIKKEVKDIIHTFASVIKQVGGDIENIRDDSGNNPEKSVECCVTLDEMMSWFYDFIGRYSLYMGELKKQRYGKDVSRAIDYISSHYMESITLADVADYVKMNESYFCYLFKKETGKNFTEFLNSLRVEKAKELFRTDDLSVYEVAEKVGFANVSYFSKVFRAFVGVSPLEYKKLYKKSS